MNTSHIELNSAFPVSVGWRHISVTNVHEKSLDFRLIGIVDQEESGTLKIGEEINLDGVAYRLLSVHHKGPDAPKSTRHVVGILSVRE